MCRSWRSSATPRLQFDRIGPEAERSFEVADRTLCLAEILAGVAEIIERIDRAGGKGERPLVACHRLGEPILAPKNVAEIVVESSIPAVSPDRIANALDRVISAALLMLEETEQMKGLGMIGIAHENLTANSLRFRHAARTLMGEGRAEPLGD